MASANARGASRLIDLPSQVCLCVLERTLLRVKRAGDTRLVDHLSVNDVVAEAHHRTGFYSCAIEAGGVRDRGGGLEVKPLTGVGWIVDVRQVVTGSLNTLLLGRKRPTTKVERAEKSNHSEEL